MNRTAMTYEVVSNSPAVAKAVDGNHDCEKSARCPRGVDEEVVEVVQAVGEHSSGRRSVAAAFSAVQGGETEDPRRFHGSPWVDPEAIHLDCPLLRDVGVRGHDKTGCRPEQGTGAGTSRPTSPRCPCSSAASVGALPQISEFLVQLSATGPSRKWRPRLDFEGWLESTDLVLDLGGRNHDIAQETAVTAELHPGGSAGGHSRLAPSAAAVEESVSDPVREFPTASEVAAPEPGVHLSQAEDIRKAKAGRGSGGGGFGSQEPVNLILEAVQEVQNISVEV